MNQSINETSLVVLDLETSGKYPIESQICEIAAMKWVGGECVDTFQTLVKPDHLMNDIVIKIHNITNEMVIDAPKINEVLPDFLKFMNDSVCVAHHAPFDLGFLAYDFEKLKLSLPIQPAICTSLLARARISNIVNHKLQTLMKYFSIDPGSAHRALDDTKSCSSVLFKCIETFEDPVTLSDIFEAQGGELLWSNFSMDNLKKNNIYNKLIEAAVIKQKIFMTYSGGSKPGKEREIQPFAVVRNPEGDYLVASDLKSPKVKRYYLHKISDVRSV